MKPFLLFMLILFALNSRADSDVVDMQTQVGGTSEEWPTRIQNNIHKVSDKSVRLYDDELDSFMKDIGLSVFEELTQFQPYAGSIGSLNYAVRAHRRIFSNHDIFDSHTVVDTFEIPINIPLWSATEAIATELSIGLNLGTSGSFKVENIRQVIPKAISSYPQWGDFSLKKEFLEKLKIKNLLRFFDESMGLTEEELKETNAYLSGLKNQMSEGEWLDDDRDKSYLARKFNNSASTARYGKLLNIFTSPLRLPIKAQSIKKLHYGEIVSYTAEGMIQLGGNIGWSYGVTGIVDPIGGQLSKTTYLNGQYRVSIINEDGRYVQVKVSRLASKGLNNSFYPITVKKTLLDGLAVVGIGLDQSVVLTPFQFSSNKVSKHSFDVIYRYDLENEEGVKAYEKAVFGLLKDSEDLSLDEIDKAVPAVEKIISKSTDGKTTQSYKKFEINFIFKAVGNKSKTIDHSVISIPSGPDQGVHYVKNGTISRVSDWSTLWNYKERKEEAFRVSLNEEKLNEGDIRGFGLTVEMNSFDNKTTGKELNSYVEKCHKVIGFDGVDKKIVGPTPLKRPVVNEAGEVVGEEKAWYGESRFLCKSQYDWFHIQKFIFKTRDEKVALIEKAFQLINFAETLGPVDGSDEHKKNLSIDEYKAISFLEKWEGLEEISENYELLHKKLTDLIDSTKDSYMMAKILHLACTERLVPFLVRAYNESFDQINLNEQNFHQVDNISGVAGNLLSVDYIGPRTKYDTDAVVSGVSVKILKTGNLELNFHLNQVPQFIFFDLQASRFDATRLRAKLIMQNKGEFKLGLNRLIIGPGISRRLTRFFSYFEEGLKYNLGIAYSRDSIRWGGVANQEFFYRIPKFLKAESKTEVSNAH